MLQSKCLRLAIDAPWYVTGRYTRIWAFRCWPTNLTFFLYVKYPLPPGNNPIAVNKYYYYYYIRALTESFDSKLADVGNPLVRQLGRY